MILFQQTPGQQGDGNCIPILLTFSLISKINKLYYHKAIGYHFKLIIFIAPLQFNDGQMRRLL